MYVCIDMVSVFCSCGSTAHPPHPHRFKDNTETPGVIFLIAIADRAVSGQLPNAGVCIAGVCVAVRSAQEAAVSLPGVACRSSSPAERQLLISRRCR